jgi:hypothetical protein
VSWRWSMAAGGSLAIDRRSDRRSHPDALPRVSGQSRPRDEPAQPPELHRSDRAHPKACAIQRAHEMIAAVPRLSRGGVGGPAT